MWRMNYLGCSPGRTALTQAFLAHVLHDHLVDLRLALEVYDARENSVCLA
jgi:hypothetical protein